MLSVVSTFLFVARIDGQPESKGALSLMQYAVKSELEAVTGADEEYVCRDFCKKSQCTWMVCKGCSFCPKDTAGCKSFCTSKSHCTWAACKGCSFCPKETENCKSWCRAHASPWADKCKLDTCKGCDPCPEPTPARADCKPWCKSHSSPWAVKCKLDPCSGCDVCPEPTPSQPTRQPTPQPTKMDCIIHDMTQSGNVFTKSTPGRDYDAYAVCPDVTSITVQGHSQDFQHIRLGLTSNPSDDCEFANGGWIGLFPDARLYLQFGHDAICAGAEKSGDPPATGTFTGSDKFTVTYESASGMLLYYKNGVQMCSRHLGSGKTLAAKIFVYEEGLSARVLRLS